MSKAFLREAVITIAIALLFFTIFQFIVKQIVVEGTSMTRNLEEGQRLFVNKTAYLFQSPEKDDVVVLKPPDQGGIPLIKSIVGLLRGTVQVESGLVYIDDVPLDEPYIEDTPDYALHPVTVPVEHYFVLGDNRNYGRDSHHGWTVPESDLIGEARLSVWPLDKLGLAPNYAHQNEPLVNLWLATAENTTSHISSVCWPRHSWYWISHNEYIHLDLFDQLSR